MTTGFRYDSPANYHLTYSDAANAHRRLVTETLAVGFLVVVMLPAALWIFSFNDYPVSGHRVRSGFTRLIFLIPIYVRYPVVVMTVLGIGAGLIAYVVRLRDRRVDFLFGPDGVAHVGLFVSKSLVWGDVKSLNLVHHQRGIPFVRARIHQSYTAEFTPRKDRGVQMRARSKLTALLSLVQTNRIVVHLASFDMSVDDFENTMLFLYPKLTITREDRVRWS